MKNTIDMAREAGWTSYDSQDERFKAFEALVRADEREACARIAEEPSATTYECTVACGGPAQTFQQRFPKHSHDIAKEIRARGNP
jgi:hypothetical protein